MLKDISINFNPSQYLNELINSSTIMELTIRKFVSSKNRRKLFITLILLFFPFISLNYLHYVPHNNTGVFLNSFTQTFYNFYIVIVLAPLCAMFALAALHEEISDGTVAFYLMQPVSRITIYFWKFIGYLIFTSALIIVPTSLYFFIFGFILEITLSEVLIYLILTWLITIIGCLAFGALFFTLGMILKKPLLTCIITGYLDQFFISTTLAQFIGWFSISYHIEALSALIYDYHGIFDEFTPLWGVGDSIIILPAFLVALLVLSAYLFKHKNLPTLGN